MSFFLFGPRSTGKSTLIGDWSQGKKALYVDLLDPTTEARYANHPELLLEDWSSKKNEWIIIDEVQKNIALLDVVQIGIVKHKIKFAITGSSARKLKRGSANLLGGRAIQFSLHPFTDKELKSEKDLIELLRWGSLPEIFELSEKDRERKLYSYVSTYLREELLQEQIIRQVEPFRKFLEIAAQMNGKILNFSKIARDAGVEERSIARYYQILEDTLLGFFIEPFNHSIRKRQSQKAKFYFFDLGVTRALQNSVSLEVSPQTEVYGNLFEHFFILECIRLNDYKEKRFKFFYLKTKDSLEVDLIIETPKKQFILIEIKSKNRILEDDFRSLKSIAADFKNLKTCLLVSNQKQSTRHGNITCIHWREALDELFD